MRGLNRLYASLLFAASILALYSCGKDEEAPEEYFQVAPTELSLDSYGGQETILVLSSEDWLIRSDQNWLKTMTASGKASDKAVRASISCDRNTTGSDRRANLTVKTLGGKVQTVLVKQSASGDGPSHGIASADDLKAFAEAVNSGESLSRFMVDGAVVLSCDVDASSIREWTPAGTALSPFTGTFDGQGHKIYGIDWTVTAPQAGLFGVTVNATLKNLTVGNKSDRITVASSASAIDAGVIAGQSIGGTIQSCTSVASVFCAKGGADVCIAGICGRFSSGAGDGVVNCTNNSDVICSSACRAAGFVAWNEVKVQNCTNNGCIIANSAASEVGPAWGCSYNKTVGFFKNCKGRGHVGSYDSFGSNPSSAPSDAFLNALASPARRGFTLTDEKADVDVDVTRDSYFDWTTVETKSLCSGVTYTKYSCTWVPRIVNVLEIDLSNPSVDLSTSFADDIVPNPNGNNNSNNGFNLRETLSQLCARKRSEGENVIAGINTGFFDSNDGIARGFHVQDGEPVYINNPKVVSGLPNHSNGFTVFTDGTASCGTKSFSGKIKVADKEFNYHSVNDTIMRNVSSSYRINLYTSRYKQYPHPEKKSLVNKLAPNALYVTAEYVGDPMKVNCGYAKARVTAIADGRASALSSPPYLSSSKQVGIALSGADAEQMYSLVKVGSEISLRCDITIEGGITKPVHTQNSTMFRVMKAGKDNTSSIPSGHTALTKNDPITFPVVSPDGKKVWLVEVDGRNEWVSYGIRAYDIYRIGLKLGGSEATRFDGGGSSAMWVYDSSKGRGGLVNTVSDSKGERSCMNYIIIKAKQ